MEEDLDYDNAHTLRAPRRSRWYTRLWPSCLGGGCTRRKRPRKFTLYSIGYDPVGEIQRAASVGDVASIERLINCHGQHVNAHDVKLRTSLHYACAHNHPDVVKLLLSKKASIDVQDDEGCTPLMKAVQRDNIRCAEILLIQGANPHLRDLSGSTALHHAISRNNTEIVTMLLHFEEDIEATTESGLASYQLPLLEGKLQMARFLAQNGASTDLEIQPYSERTPSERTKPKKEKHVKFNKVVHYSTDPKPFGSGVKPSQPLKSILKTSAPFYTANGKVQQRAPLWLYETPDAPAFEPEAMDTPSTTCMKTEKKLSDDSNICTSKKSKTEMNLYSLEECDFTRDLFEEQERGGGEAGGGEGGGGGGEDGGGGKGGGDGEQEQQEKEEQQEEKEEQEAEFVIQRSENALSKFLSYSERTPSDRTKPKKEKHVKFNKVVHYITDPKPFGSGVKPSQPLKSILKTSALFYAANGRVQQRAPLWLYEIPDAPAFEPEAMDTPSTTCMPSEHVKPASTYGDDRVDAVDHKNNADSTQSTAVDSTITLEDMPMLLIMGIVWLVMFLLLVMVTIQHLINEMSRIASSNQNSDQVAAEAEH